MSSFRLVTTYPYAVDTVWAALTDPDLVPRWTSTGQGARPEGFEPVVGNRFRLVGTPLPGWDGVVHCEVLEVQAPVLLRYSWANRPEDHPSIVSYELAPSPDGGTTLAFDHTGLRGIGGFFLSRLLSRVRRRMLHEGLPPVLRDLAEAGTRPEGRPRQDGSH